MKAYVLGGGTTEQQREALQFLLVHGGRSDALSLYSGITFLLVLDEGKLLGLVVTHDNTYYERTQCIGNEYITGCQLDMWRSNR